MYMCTRIDSYIYIYIYRDAGPTSNFFGALFFVVLPVSTLARDGFIPIRPSGRNWTPDWISKKDPVQSPRESRHNPPLNFKDSEGDLLF